MNTGSAPDSSDVAMGDAPRSAAASPEDFSDEPITSDAATLLVYGMSCPLCASNVDEQLLALPGVTSAHVDLSNGWVTVKLTPGATHPSQRDLATAIVESGMTIIDIQAD